MNPDDICSLARPLSLFSTGALLEAAEDQPINDGQQVSKHLIGQF